LTGKNSLNRAGRENETAREATPETADLFGSASVAYEAVLADHLNGGHLLQASLYDIKAARQELNSEFAAIGWHLLRSGQVVWLA
jgi:hypothetical protein